jgi:ribosome biogenesis protein MAK21
MLYWYEENLLKRIIKIIEAIEEGLKSNILFFKKNCMTIASDLLINKPEQEARLLSMLVNKLGDPSKDVCSKCTDLLRKLLIEVIKT